MSAHGLAPAELSQARIDEFLVDRRADEYRRSPHRRGLVLLLEHLIDQNVVVCASPPRTALDELIGAYREWLISDRGLAAATVLRYENTARRFLQQRICDGSGVDVAGLTGTEVNAFLLAECARCSVGAAKGRVAELRALLRYMYLRGMTAIALAAAVPPVAGWHRDQRTVNSDFSIVAQYQAEFRGVAGYYQLAFNLHRLGRLRHVMQRSLVKTLARKYRVRVSRIYRRYRAVLQTYHGPRRGL